MKGASVFLQNCRGSTINKYIIIGNILQQAVLLPTERGFLWATELILINFQCETVNYGIQTVIEIGYQVYSLAMNISMWFLFWPGQQSRAANH